MDEDDEAWLEAAFKVEEIYLSTQVPPPPAPPPIVPPPAPAPASEIVELHSAGGQQRHKIPVRDSFSPPRVLSQRVVSGGFNDAVTDYSVRPISPPSSSTRRYDSEKDLEIERLKKELGRVSKQLLDMEQECSQLKKGKSKEAEFKNSHSEINGRGGASTAHASRRTNLEPDAATSVNDGGIDSTTDKRSFKTTGVQADLANHSDLSKKLLDIWRTSNYQDPRRNLISQLLLACSTDLQILFGFMNTTSTPPQENDRLAAAKTVCNMQSSKALESEKVCQLYSAVTKISYGFVNLKTLVKPLLDLCKVENAILVHRSLHVLHVLLEHVCGVENRFDIRDNITDEEESSSCEVAEFHGYKGGKTNLSIGESEGRKTNLSIGESVYSSGSIPLQGKADAETSKKSQGDTDKAQPSWDANWHSLFELMNQIASRRTEENVKLEAVSIMNIIVMRSNAYTERETFISKEVFESISLLLRKEAGLRVRKGAIHLFFLLLNCPKVLARFDALHEENKSSASGTDSQKNLFALEAFGKIFEGLADCLTSPRKTSEDLELCRNVIMILALAASSGNSGYELLSSHNLPQDTSFLMLILHLLAAEIDSESTELHPNAEIFKARTLLMREILILLNRLVSGSSSSCTILRELTKSRDMASLTVDAATRLSRKRNLLGQPESSVERMRGSEITDLARIFKRRVFSFLGDNST
ncbi:Protein SENSITIVE TO UV 2 [Hirschfeldia incana]|nr:Protein SENSITIVE TO UV 2 [Hirschfeldia incana]